MMRVESFALKGLGIFFSFSITLFVIIELKRKRKLENVQPKM